MFTPFSPIVENPAGKLAFSVVIVLVTFGFKRFRYFFQNLFSFYFATFLMGGGIIGAHSLPQSNSIVRNGVMITNQTGFGDPISWMFIVAGFPALWFFSKRRIEDIETKTFNMRNESGYRRTWAAKHCTQEAWWIQATSCTTRSQKRRS